MDFKPFLSAHRLNESYLNDALKWFKPLGDALALHQNNAKGPYYVGVNGAQGSGKSTVSAFLAYYLTHHHNKTCVVMSLDDFYLSQSDRFALSIKVHPLLKTRGVPGTHDVDLIAKTLNRLSEYGTVSIPQFDKATDNPKPVTEWPIVNTPIDIVILEGWCWGVAPQSNNQLAPPINSLEKDQDALGNWRNFVNQQLKSEYQSLHNMMNYWVMLQAPSFSCVEGWRIEQEHKLKSRHTESNKDIASNSSASGIMTDDQIRAFIMHFQRLTQHSLNTLPAKVDCLYALDIQRKIISARANFL